jgi:hypothetical protein
MKYNYDYAAEMVKIASSSEHKKLFGMEKVAFSRDGQTEELSEVESEMRKLAKDCSCEDDCDCKEKAKEEGEEEKEEEEEGEKKEASDTSLEDTASLLLEISNELEDQGMDRLAAASLVLADNILKTAADRKSKSTSDKAKKSVDDKKPGKKLTMKERMEKMRAMQKGKGKGKGKEDKKKEEKLKKK